MTAVIFVVLLALVGVSLYQQYNVVQPSSPWSPTTPYPLQTSGETGVAGQPCVLNNESVVCVGGQDFSGSPNSVVYSAQLTAGGLGNWTSESAYPTSIMFQPCVSYGGFIYCVGGAYDGTADDVAFAYFAPLTSLGVGSWKDTTPYPIPADSQACVASSGYIYCLGGENETAGTNATAAYSNSAWYAPISSSGIGVWNKTTAYPPYTFFPSCTAFQTYLYCLGGETSGGSPLGTVYFATLSSGGIGKWQTTTAYPFQAAGQDCVTSSEHIYCIGGWTGGASYTGSVYYAPISPGGVGAWVQAAAYPLGATTSCVVGPLGEIYCVGGYEGSSGQTDASYYGLITIQPTLETNST